MIPKRQIEGERLRHERMGKAFAVLSAVEGLPLRAIAVGTALAWHHGAVKPSQDRLAEMTRQSVSTVNVALSELERRGLIERYQVRAARRRRTGYKLHFLR